LAKKALEPVLAAREQVFTHPMAKVSLKVMLQQLEDCVNILDSMSYLK